MFYHLDVMVDAKKYSFFGHKRNTTENEGSTSSDENAKVTFKGLHNS